MLSRHEVVLLNVLYTCGCDNDVRAVSIKKISRKIDMSYHSTRIMLVKLLGAKYVSEGCKDGRSTTYYITEKGKMELNRLS